MLTLREYHIAVLAARRIPYSEIAKQHGISKDSGLSALLESVRT
jgi:DNA-binding CsgD family transcriptional regulator